MDFTVIVGANGQDGSLLAEALRAKGVPLIGIDRQGMWREKETMRKTFSLEHIDSWQKLFRQHKVAEVYYLAAYHHSSSQRDQIPAEELWERSMSVNFQGWLNVLQVIQSLSAKTKAFYAASCLVFGHPSRAPQDETTPFSPTTPYGLSKWMGIEAARYFRRQGIYAATGILYNHESSRRRSEFVSRKIVSELVEVSRGLRKELVLRQLAAKADWGYAPDFIEAIQLILQLPEAEDFIIATGQSHSVGEFAQVACQRLNLDFTKVVKEEAPVKTSQNLQAPYTGDPTHLVKKTGWVAKHTFTEMVNMLIEQELQKYESKIAGICSYL